jgi:hypothetical protein
VRVSARRVIRFLVPAAGALVLTSLGIVSAAAPQTQHAEPWLAIDPRDPTHAVRRSMVD